MASSDDSSNDMGQIFEYYKEIIPDFSHFIERLFEPTPVHLRINQLKADPLSLVKGMRKRGIRLRKSTKDCNGLYFADNVSLPGKLFEYFLGYLHPQALTSCLASMVLCPAKGAFVLDMCAAPGGKTAHLAQIMENTGLIIANELVPGRHIPLGNTMDRLGVVNSVMTAYQAQQFPMKENFDFVLADVPCSGEGVLRGKACRKTSRAEEDAKESLAALQKKIILRGFDLLKDKGEMLYSTCTYDPCENEEVVDFLLKNREAELLPINLEVDYEPGIMGWRDKEYDTRIHQSARFYPHRVNSVGFFMARIGRRQGA